VKNEQNLRLGAMVRAEKSSEIYSCTGKIDTYGVTW
jgi:hypothetical protein